MDCEPQVTYCQAYYPTSHILRHSSRCGTRYIAAVLPGVGIDDVKMTPAMAVFQRLVDSARAKIARVWPARRTASGGNGDDDRLRAYPATLPQVYTKIFRSPSRFHSSFQMNPLYKTLRKHGAIVLLEKWERYVENGSAQDSTAVLGSEMWMRSRRARNCRRYTANFASTSSCTETRP